MNKEYMQRIAGIKSVGKLNESIGGYVDLKPFNHINELEKPEKIYADDQGDSKDNSNFDEMLERYELQLQRLVVHIIDEGYEPEDAAQFLRDYADHIDNGGFMGESFDKDMSDIALGHSNNNPNTPPGAKAGELPKQNEGEDPDDTDDVNPFPSIVKEKEYADDEDGDWDSFDDDFNEDDRFAELGGKEMDSIIKNLMDSGFTAKDIVQYVVDKASAIKSFKKEDASDIPDASGEADEELTPSGEFDWDV
jgi:hypothetical protein